MFNKTVSKFKQPLINAITLTAIITGAMPANAHHAFSAEFDAAQPVEVKGVVTKFELVNPHSWLYVDVKGPDGKVTNWGFEFGAPYNLKEKGITKKSLTIGSELTIKGYRAKSGQNFAYATVTTLADGRSVQTGGAADAPTTPAPVAR